MTEVITPDGLRFLAKAFGQGYSPPGIKVALEDAASEIERLTLWKPVEYTHDDKGIILPPGPPFDGEPVLVRFAEGVAEVRWEKWQSTPQFEDPDDGFGFCWIVLDDSIHQKDLDDAEMWMPIPECIHAWIDVRNDIVKDGELCQKCGAVRPGNETTS